MKEKTTSILYFSPTGNVKHLSEKLQALLGTENSHITPIEKIEPADLSRTGHLIVMFSIHGFNPPRTVKRFVKALPEGLCESISLVAVGCAESWVNEAVTLGLRNTLESKGYAIAADKVMAMPLTFIMSFPEEMARNLVIGTEEKLQSLIDEIKEGNSVRKNIMFKSRLINFIGKIEDPASKMFGLELYANKSCTSCGICVQNCPEKNIRFNKKNKPVFGLKCLMCLRCVYNCPEKAIKQRTARFIPIKGGYSLSRYQD